MKRSLSLLIVLLMLPVLARAADPHVQASMIVNGSITVNPDGSVRAFKINQMDALQPAVRQIIQDTVPHWQFVPIMEKGKAVEAQAGMTLRIVANMLGNDHAALQVAGASFGCDARPKSNLPGECPPGTAVTDRHRKPPRYPIEAVRDGVGGEVFLVLRIGRDGHVTHVAVRQVNLYARTGGEATFYRKMLADASLQAARKWTFGIPTVGPNATKAHWVVTVPVNYTLGSDDSGAHRSTVGRWNSYLPGPVQVIPWQSDAAGSGQGADAIAGGAPFMRDQRFVLKTALADGSPQT